MIRWFVDKDSKVPLYLQIKELVQYYISTGALEEQQQLPTVSRLASELGVTFETVRKAYKELDRDGLIASTRGRGTFVNAHSERRAGRKTGRLSDQELVQSLRDILAQFCERGFDVARLNAVVEEGIRLTLASQPKRIIFFTECNTLQTKSISQVLHSHMGLPVRPVLLEDLPKQLKQSQRDGIEAVAVVTTGFHVREVRSLLNGSRVPVEFVITRMSPQTRREIAAYNRSGRFGFICRDERSIAVYKDLLKAELDIESELSCCTIKERGAVRSLLQEVDVLLVSPTVYKDVKKLAPAKLPVFNVFDWVDPMSLAAIKDRIVPSSGFGPGLELGQHG